MMTEKGKRAADTLEFKLEAVRPVHGGQAKVVTAKVLGIPVATLGNWVRLEDCQVGRKHVSTLMGRMRGLHCVVARSR